MIESRMKIAAGLLTGVLSVLAAAQAAHAAPVTVSYACDSAQRLVVRRSGDVALVQFVDRTYLLKKASSSIGEKFLAPTAALIIDGRSAVFVAEDRLQLGQCLEATRVASAR